MPDKRDRPGWWPALIAVLVIGLMVVGGTVALWRFIGSRIPTPDPVPEQCVATANTLEVPLTLEQSENAAIIVAESIRRGLPSRAATIALATAYQESGLRNLDYGDRDSVGLFQQRPSQGWGTDQQIMDPWYSAGKFYEELVKFDGWQTGDITTFAQKVQRSGFPEAYRKHEENAKVVASVLTGHSPAGWRCLNRSRTPLGTAAVTDLLARGFGTRISTVVTGSTITITAPNQTLVWAAVQVAMATTGASPVAGAGVAGQTWTNQIDSVASWQGTPSPAKAPFRGTVSVLGQQTPSPAASPS